MSALCHGLVVDSTFKGSENFTITRWATLGLQWGVWSSPAHARNTSVQSHYPMIVTSNIHTYNDKIPRPSRSAIIIYSRWAWNYRLRNHIRLCSLYVWWTGLLSQNLNPWRLILRAFSDFPRTLSPQTCSIILYKYLLHGKQMGVAVPSVGVSLSAKSLQPASSNRDWKQ